jgi:hypothetical protein
MNLPNIISNQTTTIDVSALDQNFTFLQNFTTGTITRAGWLLQNTHGYIMPVLTPNNLTPAKISFGNATLNTFTVPQGVSSILVKMWGGGGGGGSYGGWIRGSMGGAGGYSSAIVPVVPGETILIRPGGGGIGLPGMTVAYPDGGGAAIGTADNRYCGNGGGSSSIQVPSISPTAYCMFAGGGGGGGACNGYAANSGGAGGGLEGWAGSVTQYTQVNGPHNGGGGTQTAGGAAGVGNSSTPAGGGQAGSFNQGGTHQTSTGQPYGGGGGGGYYGGGAGAYGQANSMGGGGGGSGYIHPSLLFGSMQAGCGRVPGNANDPDLSINSINTSQQFQYAIGGDQSGMAGFGLVIFYY